ncbi:NDP-sugar synthase [Candidatus Bathyarchaeota archaeon]|nr:NDP-sugar synthase [Candidatus Bathyarchaeota archaeon]
MKAMILIGGFATRLRPLSCTRPKALFPILNKPLLQWTFERLAEDGIKEVILAVNHQAEVFIKEQKIPKNGLKITYSRDPLKKPLGTGGPIKKAEKLVGHDSPFLVLNGDIFADINYKEIFKTHEKENAMATIALHNVKDPSKYGVAELVKGNYIKKFVEKPPRKFAPSNLINAGVYVLSPEIFELIPKARKVSIEREVFPKLAEEGRLCGYILEGLWIDIGEPREFLEINKTLLNSLVPLEEHKARGRGKIKEPVAFDKNVSTGRQSVIGPYVVLGRNVTIGNSVCIKDSVVFPDAVISDFSIVNGSIIGEGAMIGKKVEINSGCIVGDHVKIRDNVTLSRGVSVCPAKEVSKSVLKPRYIV